MLAYEDSQIALSARVGVLAPSAPTAVHASSMAAPRAPASGVGLVLHTNLAEVAAVWQAFERLADCTAFQTFAWHEAWQRHIGDRNRVVPAIVEGRRDGRLLFIMPLAVEHGLLARRLVWHASDLCDYNAPLLAPDFTELMLGVSFQSMWADVEALIAGDARLRHDVVILERMPDTLARQPNPFLRLAGISPHASNAHFMRIAGDWDTFYRAKRSSATRRHDRAKRRHLEEIGMVRMVTAADRPAVEAMLDVLFAQKAASFAGRGVPNFLARAGYRAFYADIAAAALAGGGAHVSVLEVGGIPAAANFGLVFGPRYYHVLASYDGGAIGRFGPGTAHLHELIAYALRRHCTEFDFTVGDEAYKRDWCENETKLYDLRLARSPRGWLVARASRGFNRLKRRVKQSPVLMRLFGTARRLLAPLAGGPVPRGTAADRGEAE